MPSGIKIRYRFNDIFNVRHLRAKTKAATEAIIYELQYADDNMIMALSEEELQLALTAFNTAYTSLSLTLNAKKTQVMYQPHPNTERHEDFSLKVGDQILDQVTTYPLKQTLMLK